MSQTKVGFVGYGGSAKTYHLPYLLPVKELKVYAFLQRAAAPTENATPGSHCTIDFPDAKHYRTAEDFFADSAIELVIVATGPDTHASFAQKAIEAGKHVVVEKPFTRTSEEADALLALAKEKGVILTVYQNRRWDGDFRTLKYLVDKNALGTITEAQIYYDFENPPWIKYLSAKEYTPGDGLLFGLGSHTLDQALVLFGRPKSVTAFLKVLRGIESEVDDTFTVILQYDSPLLVTVKTTIIACMPQPLKYFVRGTEGSYVKYGDDIQERQTLSGMKSTDAAFGVNPEDEYGTLTTYKEFDSENQKLDPAAKKYSGKFPTLNGFNQGYYEALADTIRRKAPLQVDPQTSRDGIRLMELAQERVTGEAVYRYSFTVIVLLGIEELVAESLPSEPAHLHAINNASSGKPIYWLWVANLFIRKRFRVYVVGKVEKPHVLLPRSPPTFSDTGPPTQTQISSTRLHESQRSSLIL
ncbi:uncharacterized protein L3040_001067 [Drepanopeziza brunnea f. sp. 'multigermtubi']|uniref:uncharacterized protein n=1 Tax=Drepanopeziza brunnea f. sp. 'multigermtubi' TaxID=698441 RepID=UPI00239E6609|nr:hypothetical protein L3040_001067 [Drepanopeziza brunnea f. sp. 'multigermtubi']